MRGLILDHRGREVPVYRPALLSFTRDDAATFPEREFQEFRKRLAKRDPAGCAGGDAFCWVLILYYGGRTIFSLATDTMTWSKLIHRLLVLTVIGVLAYLVQTRLLPLSRKHHAYEIQTVLLGMRRCPSCAFDLRGTPEDANGCRECPECGAAWKLR